MVARVAMGNGRTNVPLYNPWSNKKCPMRSRYRCTSYNGKIFKQQRFEQGHKILAGVVCRNLYREALLMNRILEICKIHTLKNFHYTVHSTE